MSEYLFGILCNIFPIFHGPIKLRVDNATKVIKACVMLHNFLIEEGHPAYLSSSDFVNDEMGLPQFIGDYNMPSAQRLVGNRAGRDDARKQRDFLANYFMNEGSVGFERKMFFGNV